ncbi:MAG: hypothetical protein JSR39_02715 [Verrucomicrobia bacterium]|nr:hypothetical protein [Verrucomicrobiota bacterium]
MKKAIFSLVAVFFLLAISSGSLLNGIEKGAVSEVYFSPQDGVADRLIARINAEKQSIKVAVYCLMHTGIAKALKAAHARGVDVEVILDPYSIKSRSPVMKMVEKGIPVYVWNPKQIVNHAKQKKKPLMHDKFCVFGDHTVWTGSFNFTREGALANRENVVVMEGVDIAKSYLIEFAAIKDAGCSTYQDFISERQ